MVHNPFSMLLTRFASVLLRISTSELFVQMGYFPSCSRFLVWSCHFVNEMDDMPIKHV